MLLSIATAFVMVKTPRSIGTKSPNIFIFNDDFIFYLNYKLNFIITKQEKEQQLKQLQ